MLTLFAACGFPKAFFIKSAKTGKYCCLNGQNQNIKVVKCDDNCANDRKFYALSNNEDILINKGAGNNPQDRCALWSKGHRSFLSVGMSGGLSLSKNGDQKLKADDKRMYFQARDIGNKVTIKNMGGEKCLKLQQNEEIRPKECFTKSSFSSSCPACEFELEAADSFEGTPNNKINNRQTIFL